MGQRPPKWRHHFLPIACEIVQCQLLSKQEGKEHKHLHGQDSRSKWQGSKGIRDKVQPTGYFTRNKEIKKL